MLIALLPPLLWLPVGCHLGRPPLSLPATGVALTRVEVAVVEAGLADDLRSGLAHALSRRGISGGDTPLELRVLDASTTAVAATDQQRVHRARLSVAVDLLGAAPRSVVLTAERSYEVSSADGMTAAAARAAAFGALAEEVAEDATLWLSLSPAEKP